MWQSLAHAGKFGQAIASLGPVGFENVCRYGTAAELLLLANVANHTGDLSAADRARLALRRRFPQQDRHLTPPVGVQATRD